jgi:hypothetical protein
MINSIKNILSPGVLEWLRPKKLVEAIHNCCRLVAAPFERADALLNTDYDNYGVRGTGSCVSIPLSYIVKNALVADRGTSAQEVLAGTPQKHISYPFFVHGLPEGVVALGKSPDSEMGLLHKDFIPFKRGYLFSTNPTKLGVIDTKTGDSSISFYYVGGKKKPASQPQHTMIYKNTNDDIVTAAINSDLANSRGLAGVSGLAIHAAAGVSVIKQGTQVTKYPWKEGDRNYVCVDGLIYSCPEQFKIDTTNLNQSQLDGLPVTHDHINNTIMFPVNNSWQWFEASRMDQSVIDDNSIMSEYPELTQGVSIYDQLKAIMLERGIETIDISNGGKQDEDIRALYEHIPVSNHLHMIRHVDVSVMRVARDVDPLTVSVIYILYSNSGKHKAPSNKSAKFILNDINKTKGVLRIDKCIPRSRVDGNKVTVNWYGASINAHAHGPRILPTSKIYGIVLVSGGKNNADDVVYSCNEVKNEPFGPGLEVLVWAKREEELD